MGVNKMCTGVTTAAAAAAMLTAVELREMRRKDDELMKRIQRNELVVRKLEGEIVALKRALARATSSPSAGSSAGR